MDFFYIFGIITVVWTNWKLIFSNLYVQPPSLKIQKFYKGKSLNNRNFIIIFFTRVLTEIVCVLFFDIVTLLRNTLGPPVHKLADAL